jgi:acetyl esterase
MTEVARGGRPEIYKHSNKEELKMKMVKWVAASITVLLVIAFAITYSWTFTPVGRLDYRAALLAKIGTLQGRQTTFGAQARERANRDVGKMFDAIPDDVRHEDIAIPAPWGEIPVRVYFPQGEGPFPAMMHFHGGGFYMGNGYVTDSPVVQQVNRVGMVVFSVDYRLAPENPYPAGLDDCYRALQWVAENADRFKVDRTRIGVMGGSAGGNLAAAVALKARDAGGPPIVFQSLRVPATDLSDTREWQSYKEMGDQYGLTVSGIKIMTRQYALTPEDRLSPYASPLLASDHHGLPPALIIAAQFDPLRDQAIAYADALKKAGVPVTLRVVPGVMHGLIGSADKARQELDIEAAALQAALHGKTAANH